MVEQGKSQTQLKPEGPEPKQVPGLEQAAAAPDAGLVAAALAAGDGSPDGHARLLRDTRIPAIQRQKAAVSLSRTRGNRYVQRLIGPGRRRAAPVRPSGGGVIQRDEDTPSLEQKLRDAVEGVGTDEDAIYSALRGASAAQRQGVVGNSGLMGLLRGDLSGDELLRAARLLAAGLTTAERSTVAAAMFDLSAAPAGKIRDATGLLMLASKAVDRNTAQRILGGDMSVHYMEDLAQPPNLSALVTGYGRDPATWTLYYRPDITTRLV